MTSNANVNQRPSGFEVQGISSCGLDCGVAVASSAANITIDGRVQGMWVPWTIAAGENLAIAKVKSSSGA